MEIKQAQVATLCNYEVLKLLNEHKTTTLRNINSGNHLATIVYEASQYLHNLNPNRTEKAVTNVLRFLQEFPVAFTSHEKLMIVNNCPKTALELSLIIHNYEERMSEDEVNSLLSIILANC